MITCQKYSSCLSRGWLQEWLLIIFCIRLPAEIPENFGENGEYSKSNLLLEVTRGMPNNPTTMMDLALWDTAQVIRADPAARAMFETLSPEALTRKLQEVANCHHLLRAPFRRFLEKYGLRGFGEIDFGRPRWIEDPVHVLESLKGYVLITDPSRAPDAVFRSAEESARKAIDILAAEARCRKHGWIKSRQVRFFAGRARSLMGVRESPKFFAVRFMGLIREEILKTAADFVPTGELRPGRGHILSELH